ncbi:CoA transferase [Saccharopolyspora sp. NPDC002686]|uniref:CoA transferase n=1 Tax=Saccharopolyspora sp. NPDC002686 TaxID=3154541 RepID=UPI003331E170
MPNVQRTGSEVAFRVASEQLAALPGDPDLLACDIDWAGPVELELPDELAVQAACGIMHVHGRAAGRPQRLGVDYAGTLAGVLAAQGVLAASLARARGAGFTSVRTSVSEAALLSVQQYLAVATADDDWQEPWRAGGRPPFTSRDGVRFELEVLHGEGWQRFWAELGTDRSAVAAGWRPFQQRFATASADLPEALHRALRAVDYRTVAAVADATGVSVLPVRDDPAPPVDVPACTFRTMPGIARRTEWRGPAPLDGIVVVESTRRIQGPMVGHLLRMLGAEVIRVEPPGGDLMRGVPPLAGDCSARFRALNDGKHAVELDVKGERGRRELHELVADADAFVHNWAPGKAAQLGLDAGDLVRTSPGLVYAWSSGWEPLSWPETPLGTDYLVQAHSGLAAAVQPADEPSAPSLMTLTDVLGGAVSAMGVLAALLHRQRTGRGMRVDSSLFSASGVLPRPSRRLKWTVLDHPLRTSDGFVVLSGRTDPERLAAVLGTTPEGIAERFQERPSGFWAAELPVADVVATPVCTDLRELAGDRRFAAALDHSTHTFPLAPWEFS